MPYLDPFPEDNPSNYNSNFKIVKPGYIEEYLKDAPLTDCQKQFIECIKDPVILSLFNLFLLEKVVPLSTIKEQERVLENLSEEMEKWVHERGFDDI